MWRGKGTSGKGCQQRAGHGSRFERQRGWEGLRGWDGRIAGGSGWKGMGARCSEPQKEQRVTMVSPHGARPIHGARRAVSQNRGHTVGTGDTTEGWKEGRALCKQRPPFQRAGSTKSKSPKESNGRLLGYVGKCDNEHRRLEGTQENVTF